MIKYIFIHIATFNQNRHSLDLASEKRDSGVEYERLHNAILRSNNGSTPSWYTGHATMHAIKIKYIMLHQF